MNMPLIVQNCLGIGRDPPGSHMCANPYKINPYITIIFLANILVIFFKNNIILHNKNNFIIF